VTAELPEGMQTALFQLERCEIDANGTGGKTPN
jgi:hypothetical protein